MITRLVLYVADLDRSRRFYSLLGLVFVEERHGDGPLHYSAELPTGIVMELYAAGEKPVTRTRLGFMVQDRAATVDALRRNGFTVKRLSLAIDPDGNRVELHDVEAISQRETATALAAGLGREEVEWLDDDDDNVVEWP
jgi:lactoylglutathione lyase